MSDAQVQPLHEIVRVFVDRANAAGVSTSGLCRAAGIGRTHFSKSLNPDYARQVDIETILAVLDHPACALEEVDRARIGMAYLFLKAETLGASRAAWEILRGLRAEVEADLGEEKPRPLWGAVRAWLDEGPPARTGKRGVVRGEGTGS